MRSFKILAVAVIFLMVQLLGVTSFFETGSAQQGFSKGYSACSEGAGKTGFKDLLDDIEKNPKNWKKSSESIIDSTKKGNKGGKSIEEVYVNKKTGEKIYKHTLKDASGKLIEKPHYRPYGKQ